MPVTCDYAFAVQCRCNSIGVMLLVNRTTRRKGLYGVLLSEDMSRDTLCSRIQHLLLRQYHYVCDRPVMQIGLVPGLSVGMGDGGTGCFQAGGGLTRVTDCHHGASVHHIVHTVSDSKHHLTGANKLLHCCLRHHCCMVPS